jgi:hypothetical protein
MTPAPEVPAPPPGPGVQVPFAAPPGERDRRRLWIGLGVGGALLAVCCVGGIFGFGALVVQTSRGLLAEATTVVTTYLDGLRDGNYPRAYDQLCENLQNQVSLDQFRTTQADQPRLIRYTLDPARAQASAVWVRAHAERENGPWEPDFRLVQEGRATAALKICAIAQ